MSGQFFQKITCNLLNALIALRLVPNINSCLPMQHIMKIFPSMSLKFTNKYSSKFFAH